MGSFTPLDKCLARWIKDLGGGWLPPHKRDQDDQTEQLLDQNGKPLEGASYAEERKRQSTQATSLREHGVDPLDLSYKTVYKKPPQEGKHKSEHEYEHKHGHGHGDGHGHGHENKNEHEQKHKHGAQASQVGSKDEAYDKRDKMRKPRKL